MKAPALLKVAMRVVEKVNGGNSMLALVWTNNGYLLLTVEDWSHMLANKRARHEDLAAIYAPTITVEQVLDDIRAH